MDWLIVLLFLVLWGIVMKALIKPGKEHEPYMDVLFYLGLILIIPVIVFELLGGNQKETK
ncbi:MAG TPA: hypothetical protein IAD02_02135 [Candidatus Enterousia intestinigallinarum]|uniref:Uncharacterized protein n=1 Tax=Candidatus Enterousia intestinigallinarum TaxID=2840790 RepID=A0A9D1JW03_9PROT|nr:hypothetical protein [Candidatus Enterousia intestinigallinarum]